MNMSPISDFIYREDDSICISFSYSLVKKIASHDLYCMFVCCLEFFVPHEKFSLIWRRSPGLLIIFWRLSMLSIKKPIPEDPYIFDYPCNFHYYLVLIILYQIILDSFWVPFWPFRIPFMSFWFPGGSVWVNRVYVPDLQAFYVHRRGVFP